MLGRRAAVVTCLTLTVGSIQTVDAHEGWGIVIDGRGRVYISDIPANTIWRISEHGGAEQVVRKHSHALVLGEAGEVYGTDPHPTVAVGGVWRLDSDGTVSNLIPPAQPLVLGLQSFIMDAEGNMYSAKVRNARSPELVLLKRSPTGEITTVAGGAVGHADGTGTDARFMGIDGMAWGPERALYLTDGPYVRRVTLDGVVSTLGPGPLTERKWDEDLLGIAVDAHRNVYIADYSNRRILRITADGVVSTVLRTRWPWAPTGVAVSERGMFVLEHLRMPLALMGDLAIGPYLRVRRIGPRGETQVLTRKWGRRTAAAATIIVAAGVVLGLKVLRPRGTRQAN